ncbi:amino acid adenylation domain-containing protein [Synoicihabitans lomoniglobus]|uniref:Amino acid adenylation domain-containing protein n=1 Tax=Synoicihabitans lomoniglobus TaxID=2909285 RepID=A0AAE9ZY32_9BACT|nr:amino acid adenylation domain-containing protein [Opitutaceae bacterium LMO-M01]WED65711.1 amino acid adenylation domain-containing protein [Opitutaceae bacterium LMO-M01]
MPPPSSSSSSASPLRRALQAIETLEARLEAQRRSIHEPIAVVGIGCRFPGGADSPAAFWELLREGRDAVTTVPTHRWDAEAFRAASSDIPARSVSRHGGFLTDLEQFDPVFFGISPREAARMDPQHRLLLEVTHEALTAAGQSPDRRARRNTGVFLGITSTEYGSLQHNADGDAALDTYHLTGNALNTAAGRIAFVCGLHGPTLAVDTACSSSLTALHLACHSLRTRECDSAVAAGVNALLSPWGHIALSRGQVLSPTGRARTFDAAADGMVRGEGCGAVVLKRLSDAERDGDAILAVVRGSAINQDGPSSGLTVPHGPAQEQLLRDALTRAGLQPSDIDYIEAHGTGTSLGDPIEVGALGRVFASGRTTACPLRLGSVKTNLGHLESAAGMAGFIKTILALHHEALPPHLHFDTPSPQIDWQGDRIVVPTKLTPWPRHDRPRRAGLSAFGFSGTNVHVVIEEGPRAPADPDRGLHGGDPGYQRQYFPLPVPCEPEELVPEDFPLRRIEVPGTDDAHWELALTTQSPAWLQDHKVFGNVVFPAAAWLELARRIGAASGKPGLRDGHLSRALMIPARTRWILQGVLRPDGAVEIFARVGSRGPWTSHFTGRVTHEPDATGDEPMPARPPATGDLSADFYADYRARGLDYGPCFQGVRALWPAVGEVVAVVQLPGALHHGAAAADSLHPALIDACFQAAGKSFGQEDSSEEVYLPVSIASWQIVSDAIEGHAELTLHASSQVDADGANVSFTLHDAHNRLVAKLTGMRLQRASAQVLRQQSEPVVPLDWIYTIEAIPAPLDAETPTTKLSGNWLLVAPESVSTDALVAAFEQAGADLTAATAYSPGNWAGVVVQAEASDTPDTAKTVGPTLTTLQALSTTTTPVWILTGDPAVHPAAAAVWGLARVAQSELAPLPVRLIGAEAFSPSRLIAELGAAGRENQILHRATGRYVPRLQPWRDNGNGGDSFALSPDRTYLITGGLGGLGRLAAAWLIHHGARHLALVGRRSPSADAAAEIEQWRKDGITVFTPSLDLCLPNDVAQLATITPTIGGVIHAAGTIADASIASQSPESFRSVAAAKTVAASLLAPALSAAELEFWITFSSSAAVLGTPGQANYAAANAWLDAFKPPARRHLVVAWGPWSVGLGAAVGDRYAARGICNIEPRQGFALLERLITSHTSTATVLPINWTRFFGQLPSGAAIPLLDNLRPASAAAHVPVATSAKLTDPAEIRAQLPTLLRREVARILRVDPDRLADDRALTLQGLDSLMAVELRHAVQQGTGIDVAAVVFLDDTPLGKLAAILAQRIEATSTDAARVPEHPALSQGQSALWFLHQTDPASAAYNTAFALRLRGAVQAPRLQQIFTQLLRRHPQLRARFPRREGVPTVESAPVATPAFELIDADGWTADQLTQAVASDYNRPFDLAQDTLLRVSVYLNSGDNEAVLLCTIHHIVTDAWTNWLLLDEFTRLYAEASHGTPAELAPLTTTYGDFVAWQNDYLDGAEGAAAWAFWERTLAGPLPVLALPTDHVRPAVLTPRGASVPLALPTSLFDRLQALAQSQGTTAFNLLLTAWQVWLHRHTGQDDIIVGSPTAGRSQPGFTRVAGYFVNPVPFRTTLRPEQTFLDLLAATRRTSLAALAHADFPLPLLVEKLKLSRDPRRPALFQNLFVFQKPQERADITTSGEVPCGDLTIAEFPLAQMEGQFELTLEVFAGGGGSLKYNTALFTAETATRFATRFRTLLEAIVTRPETTIDQLEMLDAAERTLVTETWNHTAPEFSCEHTLAELLLAQAERTPNAPALTFGDTTLSYRELHAQAGRLAHALQTAGVRPDGLVGVCAERSVELVVALLGTVLAGGAYVPLDPSYPEERLAFMHADSGVQLVLTTNALADAWTARGAQVLVLDQSTADSAAKSSGPALPSDLTPDRAAYLIYTSGSTGRPKGALNTHRAIVNRLRWMQAEYPLGHDDVVMQKTPFSFDVSVWEFFWPLLTGARLVVARPGGHQDPAYLVDLIRRERVTTLHFVPSMLQLFTEASGIEDCASLRRVICSGEAMPADLPPRFFARHSSAELHNLYGPTEAAVDVTYWACHRDAVPGPVPIGRPVARTQVYVLDSCGAPVPIGVAGELHLGGVQLMRGYHNRPDLNAEKLIPNPFSTSAQARLYRTGDLVRWRSDGALDYLGRIDGQVKLRGFRIELGEIESVLTAQTTIREAAVILREDQPGDPRLTAYVVATDSAHPPEVNELRRALREKLPDYMVPAAFVVLPRLPLSPNGKLDRRALPASTPEFAAPISRRGDQGGPASPSEQRLAAHWRELLGHDRFGPEDNFFDLGGHSLHLGRLHARLQSEGTPDLQLVELFQYSTIRSLAQRLDALTGDSSPPEPANSRLSAPRRDPLRDQRARRRAARALE